MNRTPEEKLRHPKPGGAIAAAREFGIDLSQIIENLRLTPDERLQKLQEAMLGFDELRRSSRPIPRVPAE